VLLPFVVDSSCLERTRCAAGLGWAPLDGLRQHHQLLFLSLRTLTRLQQAARGDDVAHHRPDHAAAQLTARLHRTWRSRLHHYAAAAAAASSNNSGNERLKYASSRSWIKHQEAAA